MSSVTLTQEQIDVIFAEKDPMWVYVTLSDGNYRLTAVTDQGPVAVEVSSLHVSKSYHDLYILLDKTGAVLDTRAVPVSAPMGCLKAPKRVMVAC